jgi:hypothetical protein
MESVGHLSGKFQAGIIEIVVCSFWTNSSIFLRAFKFFIFSTDLLLTQHTIRLNIH